MKEAASAYVDRFMAEHIGELSAADAAADIAALRREYIIEALDGIGLQATAAIRFLRRREDGCAAAVMGRMFDFARKAAVEMKALREPSNNEEPAA